MTQIHLISHTHWDREWYLPYQLFRLRLVALIDGLLDVLAADPDYRHFMLDGQTIVLDDYLEYRPENEELLRRYIQEGRILIGPWHILPDEFLVSPEATIRNLLQGDRTSRRFGKKMEVGYIPDPFGHIGQMPQILKGFGINSAVFQRGLSTDTTEFWWQAPDGSRVFTVYLRDGYGNAAYLPVDNPERCFDQVKTLSASLNPYIQSPNVLLMFGTDHMEPPVNTSQAVAWINQQQQDDQLIHSTLPCYISSAKSFIDQSRREIPVIRGEMRSSQRSPVLPGVLSARMWIKQRNRLCENLLEKWVEPFSAFAQVAEAQCRSSNGTLPDRVRLNQPQEILRRTWRLLMENHPHDSICGCSIDQVHSEMSIRFDQVEQVGEELTRQSLQFLADQVDTASVPGSVHSLVVFNPTQFDVTGPAEVTFQLPANLDSFIILDDKGERIPYRIVHQSQMEIGRMDFDKDGLAIAIGYLQTGEFNGSVLESYAVKKEGSLCKIRLVMKDRGEPDQEVLRQGLDLIQNLILEPELTAYAVQLVSPNQITLKVHCRQVPGFGCQTYWILPADTEPVLAAAGKAPRQIENEFFTVEALGDGTLTVLDKRTGTTFSGLNRFVDGGDRGDEYNYCSPSNDGLISPKDAKIQVEHQGTFSELLVSLNMMVPESLADGRDSRSEAKVPLSIETRVTLTRGVARIDVETHVENRARDHRLRVHFPAPICVDHAFYDGHFEMIERPLGVPAYDETWIEAPRPEQPQRICTSVTDGSAGLMIANQGLPEVEVGPCESGTEITLTLLRCVGWLSRDDLDNRRGHAGPGYETPGAQMPGRWAFHYSIIPFADAWEEAYPHAIQFNTPPRAVATPIHQGLLPHDKRFCRVDPETFIISSIKWSEDGAGIVVRGYNIASTPSMVHITPAFPFISAVRVRIDESVVTPLSCQADGSIAISCLPHEIITIKLLLPLSEG